MGFGQYVTMLVEHIRDSSATDVVPKHHPGRARMFKGCEQHYPLFAAKPEYVCWEDSTVHLGSSYQIFPHFFIHNFTHISALTKLNTIFMPLVKFAQPEDNACVAFTGSIIFDYNIIIVPNILTLYTIKLYI